MAFSNKKIELNALKKGERARIIKVGGDVKQRRKLLALGFMPGEMVTLQQKFPVLLIKVGHSYVALDKDTGHNVLVSVEGD